MREPAEIAAMLRELVDVLLPGNGRFPAASDAGTHGVVADRLVAQLGDTALDDLARGPSRPAAGRLGHLSAAERQDVVRRFEADHPEQFETLRMIAYLSYYESPAVVRAVRSLGQVYNDAPQPAGYTMAPFDERRPSSGTAASPRPLRQDRGRGAARSHTPAVRSVGSRDRDGGRRGGERPRCHRQGCRRQAHRPSVGQVMANVGISNVYKSFGPVEVIHGIDVEIADRELVVLVGPSGCGKSTLLRMIAGLEDITAGEISIGDKVVNRVAAKDRNIAMVFQSYALYPHMTVYRNMSFGLRMRKIAKEEQDRRIRWAAEILELTDYLKRYPRQLSGGQRQRVAMGRALVREPIAFLFDEPLSNLDAQLRVQMRTEIRELHQRLQTTMIYVTHDQVEAMTLADRIVVMRDGYIEQIGTPEHVYDRPANTFVAGFIGSPQMNMLPGTLGPDGTIALEGGVTVRHAESLEAQSGRSVLYGIRPEDMQLVGEGEGFALGVDVVETTGREIELFGTLGSRRICVLLQARALVRPGDTVWISPAPERAHIFDAESGVRIDAAGPA